MGLKTLLTVAAMAFAGAIFAQTPAGAASLSNSYVATESDRFVHRVGFRHERRDYGGITYVGRHGLKYAPRYGHRRYHGHDVTVKIYVGDKARPRYRQEAKPWIYDLQN